MNKNDNTREKYFRKYGIISILVLEIVVFVVVGFVVGRFLDQKLQTQPFLLFFGVISGFVIGIYKFYVDTKSL
jgi:F0F1-type ATP synthase assembly protein I